MDAPLTKQCCVVGGGPAGMMLGFLLARAGVEVAVLEKHPDFLRDFRGDTVHPSTLELMYELGLLDEFLKLPHSKIERLSHADRRRTPAGDRPDASADAVQIYRADAAMGFSQFSGRAGQALQDLRSAHAGRGHRSDRGGRPHRRLARQDARRPARDPRRSRRRLRRPAFDGAREGRLAERRLRRADGRAVVSHHAQARRRRRNLRPYRSRHDAGHARPRRLLAMRLCHSEGRHRDASRRPASRHSASAWSNCRRSSPTASARSKAWTT